MVKRKSWKSFGYLAFALLVMMMCWEANKTSAAVIEPVIPKDAIRLRILANSDSAGDQQLKRFIRDAIVDQMNQWVTGPHTIEEARMVVNQHLPELNTLVGSMLADAGQTYGYKVELGIVPFPTKMYGDQVYPAGNYEALRVTLGQGAGQNWWCVLFPPLCFVDAATGEAVAKDKQQEQEVRDKREAETKRMDEQAEKSKVSKGNVVKAASADTPVKADLKIESKKQVKFYIWEKVKSFFSWVKKLFA